MRWRSSASSLPRCWRAGGSSPPRCTPARGPPWPRWRSPLRFCLLREVEWTRRTLLACLGVLVALSVVFVGVGFVEYARKELFLNPKVITANQFEDYFRVNSLFFDPNIYGRFLAMVMLAVTAALLWRAGTREVVAGGLLLALLWGGL